MNYKVKVGQVYKLVCDDTDWIGVKYYVTDETCSDGTLKLRSVKTNSPWSNRTTFNSPYGEKFELVEDTEDDKMPNEFKHYKYEDARPGDMFVDQNGCAYVCFDNTPEGGMRKVCKLSTGETYPIAVLLLKKVEHDGIIIKVVEKKVTHLEAK